MRLYFCSMKKCSHFAQPRRVHGNALCPDPWCVSQCPPPPPESTSPKQCSPNQCSHYCPALQTRFKKKEVAWGLQLPLPAHGRGQAKQASTCQCDGHWASSIPQARPRASLRASPLRVLRDAAAPGLLSLGPKS